MSEVLEKIKSRGYWKVIIRPATFAEKRVESLPSLYGILLRTSVELRGLGFPDIGSHVTVRWDKDWIGQERDWEWYLELWRFYQSGQFVDFRGIGKDWQDNSILYPPGPDWAPGRFLEIEDIVDQYTEVFEFASRLAFTEAGAEQMRLEIGIHGIKGRRLATRAPLGEGSYFKSLAPCAIDNLPYKIDLPKAELVARSRELSLKPATELFQCFGWNPNVNVLRDIQSGLFQVRPIAAR